MRFILFVTSVLALLRRGLSRCTPMRVAPLLLLLLGTLQAHADLEDIQKRGALKVGVYEDFWPWADKNAGLDVDIAQALAQHLGLRLEVMSFVAKDDMETDLRNMVTKGTYMGYGPADVMMHVPVDLRLMKEVPEAVIIAPYFHERIMYGYDTERLPDFVGPESLGTTFIGVVRSTISGVVLLDLDKGKYVSQIKIYDNAEALMKALKTHEVAAVLATRAEIQAGISDDSRYQLLEANFPQIPGKGWTVGLALKAENKALDQAVQNAMEQMLSSGEIAALCKKRGITLIMP